MSDPGPGSGVDVLALGAHPDDVEVGCGGVLAMCVAAGMSVAIADLSPGELGTKGSPAVREREAQAAAEALGVRTRLNLGLPDGAIGSDPGHRAAVVAALRTLRPRIVLAPYHVDDRHPDHAAAGRLARDAAFLAGVARWAPGVPHRPARVHHYLLHHLVEPSFVVDVSQVWEQRTAAVSAYASQFDVTPGDRRTALDGTGFVGFLEARARVYGAMIGVERGEPFHCTGPVGLATLPDVGPEPGPDGPPVYRSYV